MSKQKTKDLDNSLPANTIGYQGGYLYFPYQMDNMIGKLLTLAETLGLMDTQEKAYKDMVKNVVYEFCGNVRWVNSDITTKIIDDYSNQGSTPQVPRG